MYFVEFFVIRHWCTPALQVLQSRVDVIQSNPVVTIRKPKMINEVKEEEENVTVNESELLEFL